jgi:hypothetical protein
MPRALLVGPDSYPSIAAAARAKGWDKTTLTKAMECGQPTYKGVPIAYAEDPVELFDPPPCLYPNPHLAAILERAERTHRGGLLGRTEVAR